MSQNVGDGSKSCKISSKDGTIFCQSIKRSRRDHRSCRVHRTDTSSARRSWASGLKTMSTLGMSSKNCMQRWKRMTKQIQTESVTEAELDEEVGGLQARDERRGSSASQSNGCCIDAAFLQHFLTSGADLAR